MEAPLSLVRGKPGDGCQRIGAKRQPNDRCVLEQAAVGRFEPSIRAAMSAWSVSGTASVEVANGRYAPSVCCSRPSLRSIRTVSTA